MSCPEEYKPSKTLLKYSLLSRAKEYPRVAALHGIAFVADSTRPKAERIGWFICILLSTAATLGIIGILMERFQTDPMLDSFEVRYGDAPILFPNIYLCPPWRLFDEEDSDRFHKRLHIWDLRTSKNFTFPIDPDDTILPSKFFNRNAPPCDRFIAGATLQEIELNCSSFKRVWTTSGICFVLPSLGIVIDQLDVRFIFNVTAYPTRVYMTHNEEEEFLRHVPFHHFMLSSRVTVELQETYTAPEAQILTRSQRKCFFPGEQLPYVKCVHDCEVANCLKFCDCVPWYFAKTAGGVKECPADRYECLCENAANIIDISKCYCRLSCDNIAFRKNQLDLQSSDKNSEIIITKRSELKYKRTVRFGVIDLLISFGGIAGLFLGCSLLSIIEFGYYFSLRTYCGAVLSVPKRRYNVTKINVLDNVQPVNLTKIRKRSVPSQERVAFYDYIN